MEQLKLEVVVVSTETIKPSTPTPTNHKLFTLSCLDQTSPFKHFPILLFYPNTSTRDDTGSGPGTGPNTRPIDITTLKTSLSETLTSFYPLAGRSNSESTILCDDQGIPFIETRVNCNLDDVLNSPRILDVLGKILPSFQLYMSYGQRPIDEVVHIAIQFNVFLCGGVVVSCNMLHKILDGASAGVFLNYWAALVRAKSSGILNFSSLNEPDFEATIKAFPPIPSININECGAVDGDKTLASRLSYLKSITVVGKSFVFNNVAIKKLKDKAASDDNKLTNPTSFEAITGFIWHHIFAAACTAATLPNCNSGPSELLFTSNIRPRISPPLPKASIGNLIKTVHARIDTLGDISKHATAVHEAIVEMTENLLENLPEKSSFANRGYKFGSYTLTSWCKLGLNEVDFGFGKPNRVIPVGLVHPVMRNYILMVDNSNLSGGIDGIEACLFLEEKEMQILESNSQFRDFASPN